MNSLFGSNKITQFMFNFSSNENIARSIAFWVVIAFALSAAICLAVLKDEKKRAVAKKVLAILFAVIVIGIIATFLVLYASETKEYNLKPILYVPFIVFSVCLLVSVCLIIFKGGKIVKITSASLLSASLIALIVCLAIYYNSGTSLELNWLNKEDVNSLGLWIGAGIFLVVLVVGAICLDKDKKFDFDTKSITYAGVLGGLSLALSYVRLFKMPMGGSITLVSMLPIALYAYIFGTKKGVVLGAIMGLLQAFQDPWILHPAQFLLDYPLAFASFGMAGSFAKFDKIKRHNVKFLLGGILAGLMRFMSHFLAGAFAFGSFGLEKFGSIYLYSLVYNSSYVLPDTALAVLVGFLLLLSKTFTKVVLNINSTKKKNTINDLNGEQEQNV